MCKREREVWSGYDPGDGYRRSTGAARRVGKETRLRKKAVCCSVPDEASPRSRRDASEGRIGGRARTLRLRLRLWCCFAFAGASRVRPRSLANVAERPAVTSRSRPIRPRQVDAARTFSPCRGQQDPGFSAATPTDTPRASPSHRGRFEGQPPQPPSSRVVSSVPASDSAPPVKTKRFSACDDRFSKVETSHFSTKSSLSDIG